MKMNLSNEAIMRGFRLENGIVIKYTIYGRKRKNWRNRRGYSRQFIKDLCEKCKADKKLTIHHIVPLSKKKDYSEKNCMTLCESCHKKVHRRQRNLDRKRKKNLNRLKEEKLKEEDLLMLEQDEWGSYRIIS
ncbi:hypothetical protein LCGC14_1067530 [marine sediment metagenome]|uniref:HNH nuclease domain-containing protein n=1 Tax=marine sediment metagenome TaxID=412755 RepID=A0A0F9Q2E0_9ZZZZ